MLKTVPMLLSLVILVAINCAGVFAAAPSQACDCELVKNPADKKCKSPGWITYLNQLKVRWPPNDLFSDPDLDGKSKSCHKQTTKRKKPSKDPYDVNIMKIISNLMAVPANTSLGQLKSLLPAGVTGGVISAGVTGGVISSGGIKLFGKRDTMLHN